MIEYECDRCKVAWDSTMPTYFAAEMKVCGTWFGGEGGGEAHFSADLCEGCYGELLRFIKGATLSEDEA